MKIPDKINICGHEVAVFVELVVLDSECKQEMGMGFLHQETIHIAKNCNGAAISEDNQAETFLHEILHLVADKFDCEVSEKQITCLATGLYQVLHDNKLKF